MPEADPLPPLREVIAGLGLRARKSFGQNFLLDLNLTGRIARAAGPLEDAAVYEVGPGPGGLTRALLAAGAARVVAVERDARCLPALEQIAGHHPGRLAFHQADALTVSEPDLLAGENRPVKVVANLPYNVGTPLLIKWLTAEPWPPWYASLTLLFQREVAERLVARPGTKAYGRLSVLAQWRASVALAFDIPARAFTPAPKVTSTVVHLKPGKPVIEGVETGALEAVAAAAFGQRRKMLRTSLKGLTGDPIGLLAEAGLAPTLRAEAVPVEGFGRLARAYQALRR